MVAPKCPRGRPLPSIYYVVVSLAGFAKVSHQYVHIKVRDTEEREEGTASPPLPLMGMKWRWYTSLLLTA